MIDEVIDPFTSQLKKKELNVIIENKLENEDKKLVTDWKIYKLILFNII